ncbi:MAG: putative rane protein [Bacteroidetes bacterium]|nr:putative rane protein [Bacteroidota bacterium]
MNKENIFKKFLPHIIAILIFLAVSAIYFSPILEGLELRQSDMSNFKGMSKELADYKEATGKGASWTNSLFGGMPSYQILGPDTYNVLNTFSKPITLWGYNLNLGVMFLYMLGFYVFVIAIGGNYWLGILAALAYALASYNIIIIEVGHITKAWAMAMMAPIFAGMILVFRKKYISGGALFIIALGLQISFSHIQITYYTMLGGIILAITYFVFAIKDKKIKDYVIGGVVLVLGSFIALIPNSSSLAMNQEYLKHTMRGGSDITVKPKGDTQTKNAKGLTIDYAYQWSYGKGETLTILIPDAKGGGSSDQRYEKNAKNRISYAQSNPPTRQNDPNINQVMNQYVQASYWGEQPFTAGTVYFGAIIIFLATLGFILIKGRERWWLLIATILSFILAWGNNFLAVNEWLFYNLPFYNKFRTPSMALVLANVTIIILAVLGLKEFFSKQIDNKKKKKALYISAGIVGGISLLCAIMPSMFASFTSTKDSMFEEYLGSSFVQALYEDRKSLFVSDAWRSFLFIAGAFAALYLFALEKVKKEYVVSIVLTVLIVFDLWGVDKRYLTKDNFVKSQETQIYPTSADEEILTQVKENNINHYRVYNLSVNTFNDASTSYFHPSIGGYHGAKLQRYQDIIDFYFLNKNYVQNDLMDEVKLMNNPIRQFFKAYQGQASANIGVLNMLDTKYLILPTGDGVKAYPNTEACGAAWFVPTIQWAKDANEEILLLDNFNPREKAIVDAKFKSIVKPITSFDSTATIKFERAADNSPEYLKYTTNSNSDAIMVCSEIYYPEDWKAYIDGKEVEYFRANYILRAINVPKGKHVVEFKLESDTFHTYKIISLIGSIIIVLIVLVAILFPFYQKRKLIKTAKK